MVFTSTVFLYAMLPLVLFLYYVVFKKTSQRNILLTLVSLIFYAWGEPWFVLVMLASIVMNWLAGLYVNRFKEDKRRQKQIVVLSIVMNLSLLFVYKYLYFVLSNLNLLFAANLPAVKLALPIGISFFTFQAMSYVIDVYRGDGEVQKKFMNVCLYISFFPQVTIGPIVRYQTIAKEITERRETFDDFSEGVRRFLIGICKKVLIADTLGVVADALFRTEIMKLTTANAWLGDIAYALQVYFDFSGYSDMAIGLGLMFGFHFLENFNYPYIAKSVAEFWRRWHISMSTWFRDYVYFPLGGSRVSKRRLILNMFILWALIGIWHGANWTYIVWGMCFFVILVFERQVGLEKRWVKFQWLRYVYALTVMLLTSVIVRAHEIGYAFEYLGVMFGIGGAGLYDSSTLVTLRENAYYLIAGTIFCMPVGAWLKKKLRVNGFWSRLIGNGLLFAGFVLSVSYILQSTYSRFLYQNF